jgi:PAS domain S-box-containing protein
MPTTGLTPRLLQERLEVALSAAHLGAWEYSPQTQHLIATPQCKANHGFAPDEDMQFATDILPAVHAEYREPLRQAIDRAIATGGQFQIEVPHRWPDGSEHWIFIAGRMADPTCMVGISRDVTDRKRMEQELREADRRKDEFMAVLAHELRAPLAPIITAVRLLQQKGPQVPELERLRDTILRQTFQLHHLVDDLLDVGRITAGKLRLDRTRVDLNAIVRQAAETCAPQIERRKHALTLRLSPAPIYVDGDAARLVQVVSNLLTNAAKYMPDNGSIDVEVGREQEHGFVRVRDRGIGIPPEMLGSIFERFVQVDSPDHRREGGLGLGLSLVKALVELHGGSVEAHSGGAGKGSEFIVRLPSLAV